MEYDLELDKVIETIKHSYSKKVLIQLPDGLKPKAKEIADNIKQETNAEVAIWMGSCFGACDIPEHMDRFGIDLLVQFGHSSWVKEQEDYGYDDEDDENNSQMFQPDSPLIPW